MLNHAVDRFPEEACGILAGMDRHVKTVIAVENKLHSNVRFLMDEKAQVAAFVFMEEQGLEMVGIFHSHPTGPPYPSERDIQEHAYPASLCLICSPDKGADWKIGAFKMEPGKAIKQEIVFS